MQLLAVFFLLIAIHHVYAYIRLPVLTAPLASLNLPFLQGFMNQSKGYYNKVTTYDVWQTPRNPGGQISAFEVIGLTTVQTMVSDADVLLQRGQLSKEILEQSMLYHCPDVCYFVNDTDIVATTNLTLKNLENVASYQIREIHEFAVAAIEKKFCFNMTVLEQKLNLSSLRVINEQWSLFIPDIVAAAIKCRADQLAVTVSELAELLNKNATTLYGYDMNQVENIFFPAFDDLLTRCTKRDAGSFICTCRTGFTGNGTHCTDINECGLGTHACSANADCINTVGSYTCQCKTGFTGHGFTCVDIDECKFGSHQCSVNADCVSTVGSYTCQCKAGFSGSGFICVDINECGLGTHACSGNATCTNTVGSNTCQCKTGFTGNGFICTVVTVILEGLQIDVTESTSNAIILVKVTGIREGNIHLNVSTYDVTALVEMNDYETRSELVVFKPNGLQVSFSVRIFDDNLVEHTEQFGVRVTSSDPEVNVVNGDILVFIRDNDKITLSIDRSVYRVNEGDKSVSVKVVVTGKTAVAIAGSVLRTADETAENPHDYTSVSQNLVIMPGEDHKNVTIAIKDDQLTEEPENIIVELTATNTNQISIERSSAIVLIHDDDDPSNPSSQEKSIGIVIGVSVAAVIVLVTVILIVARFICRRKESPDNTRNIGDIQNAAYEGEKQQKKPRMPKKPHSEPVYDEPTVYAQLDSATRVPIDANYQSLNKENCGQLQRNQNENVQPYASLSIQRNKVPGKPAQGIYMTP